MRNIPWLAQYHPEVIFDRPAPNRPPCCLVVFNNTRMTIGKLARIHDMPKSTLASRLLAGKSVAEAIGYSDKKVS